MDRGRTIRRALPSDAEAIARIKLATWRSTYAPILDPAYLANLTLEGIADDWRRRIEADDVIFVEEEDGMVRGYALWMALPVDDWRHKNMLAALYVDPDSQGRGVGKRLIATCALWAMSAGHSGMMISAFEQNTHALDLYRSLGAVDVRHGTYEVDGRGYPDILLAFDDLIPLSKLGSG